DDIVLACGGFKPDIVRRFDAGVIIRLDDLDAGFLGAADLPAHEAPKALHQLLRRVMTQVDADFAPDAGVIELPDGLELDRPGSLAKVVLNRLVQLLLERLKLK